MSRIAPASPPRQRQPRVPDKPYTDSFEGTVCEACGKQDETVVPAHMSLGNYARGMKADDALVAGLCGDCHSQADSDIKIARMELWMRVLKKVLRDRHAAWKEGRDG